MIRKQQHQQQQHYQHLSQSHIEMKEEIRQLKQRYSDLCFVLHTFHSQRISEDDDPYNKETEETLMTDISSIKQRICVLKEQIKSVPRS